jgi:hypothetical protein
VAANYQRAGIRLFVLAYFVRSLGEVQDVREALGLPLRVIRLTVPLPVIERRLAGDVTSGRRDDLLAAAASIAAAEGSGRGCGHQQRPSHRGRGTECNDLHGMALGRRIVAPWTPAGQVER